MKNSNKLRLAVAICLAIPFTNAFAQRGNKPTLGVLYIHCHGVIQEPEEIGSMLRIEMEKTKSYDVLDAFDVQDVLVRSHIDINSCLGRSCVMEAGKLLHADKMLLGNVERFGENIAITLKIIDVNSGETEKTNTTEYLNLQKEMQKMIEISVMRLVGKEPDASLVDILVAYNQPIESPRTKVNLSGPRAGFTYTSGDIGARMHADKTDHGGLGMYKMTSVIGWQQEKQYLSSGNFQGLVEFIFTGSGLESGRFIPAFTFLNGFRLNRQGWEIAFGPTFRFVRKADGYYDKKDYDPVKDWHLVSEWNEANGPIPSAIPVVSNIDDRGQPALSTGLVIAVGRTFKSGYLNMPVNVYIIPNKHGNVYGMSLGFNIVKSSTR